MVFSLLDAIYWLFSFTNSRPLHFYRARNRVPHQTMNPTGAPAALLAQKPLDETLTELKQAIWQRRPVLGDIMQKHGQKNLFEYSKDFFDVNPLPSRIETRREELISIVEEQARCRLGADTAHAIAKQLRSLPLISTADHHAIIDNPYWVNANLITALPCLGCVADHMPYLVVFSFASVSLNNPSGFPRGIEFHGGLHGDGPTIRLPLFPDKMKMGTVHGTRAYGREDIEQAKKYINNRMQAGDICKEKGALVHTLIDQKLAAPDILALPNLSEQISALNYRLWPSLFHAKGCSTPTKDVPDLAYLDIETIVTQALLRHHLHQPESLIYKALFDANFVASICKKFDGIPGAFCLADNSGTHFFWAVDEKLHRVRLQYENGFLRSHDGSLSIEATPRGIEDALQAKRIFPSTALCYLVVAMHYGMKCLGGFSQVHDLTVLKEAWCKVLNECGEHEEAQGLERLQTKEMNAGGMILTFFRSLQDRLVIPTGIDMLLEKDQDTSPQTYIKISQDILLDESMLPMVPSAYSVFYPSHERTIDTSALTFQEIAEYIGLNNKLLYNL